MPPLSILLLGNVERAEFDGVEESLARCGAVTAIETSEAAARALTDGELQPDWIVVAQAYPGEISRQMLETCRRCAPLARIVGILGSWCEGETRTGLPWPATARSYWHQWPVRATREFVAAKQGRPSAWSLPVTASDEERVLAEAEQGSPCEGGFVVIHSQSRDMADWLAAALARHRCASLWQSGKEHGGEVRGRVHVAGATAVICDASDFGPAEEAAVRECRRRYPGVPVMVLVSFPRPEDWRRIGEAGGVMLSKPLSIGALLGCICNTQMGFSNSLV